MPLDRQGKGIEDPCNGRGLRRGVTLLGAKRVQCRAIGLERGDAFVRCRPAFVGEIVGAAREPIDVHHRAPHGAGQEDRSDRKVFVVTDGHCNR